MKHLITSTFLLISLFSFAQYCDTPTRFSEKSYFSSNEIHEIEDTIYAVSLNREGDMQSLAMDIYYPQKSVDELSIRPTLVMFHGGGFYMGDKSQHRYECIEFAKKGFVCATVQYRLGSEFDTGTEALKRSYRASQDGHAAFRFLIENAEQFGIDTSWMFVGGYSAGSLLSHDLIYGDQSEWNAIASTVVADLGLRDTSGNEFRHDLNIKGLYNNCGSSNTFTVDNDQMIPTVAFHKEYDHLVPIDESGTVYGSRKMHELLEGQGVCTQLTVDTNEYNTITEGHCAYTDLSGTITRTNKAACFIKSVICEDCSNNYEEELSDVSCSNSILSIESFQDEMTIYPNPFHEEIQLDKQYNAEDIDVFDVNGKSIPFDLHQTTITIKQPSGVYFLRVMDENSVQTIKMIKE